MKSMPFARPLVALGLLVALAALPACSDGGGGGPTAPPNPNAFNSGTMVPGESFSHAFPNAGSIGYRCDFHPAMVGTVTVATGQADSVLVAIVNSTSTGFAPASFSIRPGGVVRWVNQHTGVNHTATSN